MTKEEIIKLAHKATGSKIMLGTLYEAIKDEYVNIYLMSFAKLIAEKSKQEQSEPNNSEYERGFIDGMQKQANIVLKHTISIHYIKNKIILGTGV